jgi:GTP-binding protein Era
MSHRAGFVSIIGNPNVGKSTLMNALVGEKLSIITSKAQTTRHRIQGFVNGEDYQVVFSDTPGILDPAYKLQESMMGFVYEALEDADIFILVVEAGQKHFDDIILGRINAIKQPVLVLINKIDKVKEEDIEAHITYWKEKIPKGQLLPVAALHKFNVDVVMNRILELLPDNPPYYPKDELTNRNMRFFISEIIREKALVLYQKEIPYSIEVLIDEYKEEEVIIRIKAFIFVARESQRRIVIGHEGKAIKRLGTEARKAIERFVDKHIYIDLSVKVKKNWRDDDSALGSFGYQKD